MPEIIRQIIGWIILVAIIWDTIISFRVLWLFYEIRAELRQHKDEHTGHN